MAEFHFKLACSYFLVLLLSHITPWASATPSCSGPQVLDAGANIWKTYTLLPNKLYAKQVRKAAEMVNDTNLKNDMFKVATIGTFLWIKSASDIENIDIAASGVPCDGIVGLVVDNLPYKQATGCRGTGPTVEYSTNSSAVYRTEYIDGLAKKILAHPETAFALIIEPGSFPRYFASGNSSGCEILAQSYRSNIPYALKTLNLPNTIIYLDVGNGGSMDWNHGRNTSAREIIKLYDVAGKPAQFRGFATNVGSWNAWDLSPGEFTTTIDVAWTQALNEQILVDVLSGALKKNGMPANATHAILDTSRNGVMGLRIVWEDWCNVDGAGLGVHPSANTRDERLDAFVWAKLPGESDGTSDITSPAYNRFCGARDAFRPSPEAGVWNEKYFEMLVLNANPALH